MIDHKSQSISNIAFERHHRTPIKEFSESDFSPLEGVPHFRVCLEIPYGNFEKRGYIVSFVTPQRSFVCDSHGVDRFDAAE